MNRLKYRLRFQRLSTFYQIEIINRKKMPNFNVKKIRKAFDCVTIRDNADLQINIKDQHCRSDKSSPKKKQVWITASRKICYSHFYSTFSSASIILIICTTWVAISFQHQINLINLIAKIIRKSKVSSGQRETGWHYSICDIGIIFRNSSNNHRY